MRYRDGLTTTLAGAAIPYGYTLVVWSSGSVVGERHGPPDLGEIALFFTGASAAYALLRLVVRGGDVHLEHWARRHHIVATSAVQGSAVAVAVAAAAAAARLTAFWPWFIAPFTATIAYLCGVAISEAHGRPSDVVVRPRPRQFLGPGGPDDPFADEHVDEGSPQWRRRGRRRLAGGEPPQARSGRWRNRHDDNR